MTNEYISGISVFTLALVLLLTGMLYVRAKREFIAGYHSFIMMLTSVSVWTFFYALKCITRDRDMMLLLTKLEYIGIVGLPISLAVMANSFKASSARVARAETLIGVVCVPAYLLFAWLNPWNLYYREIQMANAGTPYVVLVMRYGPAFYFFQTLMLGAILGFTILLCVRMAKNRASRGQVALISAAVLLPLTMTVLYIAKLTLRDWTNPCFAVSAALVYLCFTQYGIFDSTTYIKRNILTLLDEAIIVLAEGGRVEYMNPAAQHLLRALEGDERGRTMSDLFPGYPETDDPDFVLDTSIPGEPPKRLRFHAMPMGEQRGQLIVVNNITEISEVGRRLDYLMQYDDSTGLFNASKLLNIMDDYRQSHPGGLTGCVLCAGSISNIDSLCAMMSIDQRAQLDRAAADFIRQHVNPGNTVASIGENQFCVFSNGVPYVLGELIPRLTRLCVAHVPFENRSVMLEFRLGMYVIEDGVSTQAALDNVTYALRAALRSAKEPMQIYDKSLKLQHTLHQSLMNPGGEPNYQRDFYLEFQPVQDMRLGKVVGAEAFMRWNHPRLGRINPNQFISVLEDTGNIGPLGFAMMEKTVESLSRLQQSLDPGFFLSINVSRWQVEDGFLAGLRAVLDRTGVNPGTLVLELKETSLNHRAEAMEAFSRAVHEMGLRLSIDGYDWWYSSFSRVVAMKCDILKIDPSFLPVSHQKHEKELVIRMMIELCKQMDIQLVAARVETYNDLRTAQQIGLTLAQGYIYGPEMSQADFESHCLSIQGKASATTPDRAS